MIMYMYRIPQQDKACEDVDYRVQSSSSSGDSESNEEMEEEERRKQEAIIEKERVSAAIKLYKCNLYIHVHVYADCIDETYKSPPSELGTHAYTCACGAQV